MPYICPQCNQELEQAERGYYCMWCRCYQRTAAVLQPGGVFYRVWMVAQNRENPVIWAEDKSLESLRLALRDQGTFSWMRVVAVDLVTKEERSLTPDELRLIYR